MTRRGPNRSTEGSRLYHETEIRRRMLRAYYGVLNRQPQFRAALRGLLEQVGLLPVPVWNAPQPPPEAERLLDAFIEDWHLPRQPGVTPDLWDSLRRAAGNEPLELGEAARAVMWPSTIAPTHNAPVAGVDSGRVRIVDVDGTEVRIPGLVGQRVVIGGAIIWPLQPLPFVYEPREKDHGPAWVREYAKQLTEDLHQNLIAQIEEVERRAEEQGWRPPAPRHRDPAELERLALRLYRAAVLRWDNDRIAGVEAREHADDDDYRPSTPQAVSNSVNRWAKILGVPLPKR